MVRAVSTGFPRKGLRARLGLVEPISSLVAFLAIQLCAEKHLPSFFRQHPRTTRHRRLMAHVLTMPAAEVGHPMPFFILVISDYRLLHHTLHRGYPSPRTADAMIPGPE